MSESIRYLRSALLSAILLSGCARAPEYAVNASGVMPSPNASYRIVQREGDPPKLSPALEAALQSALRTQGLVAASTDAKPDLLLFAGLSLRPARVGVFTRDNPADAAEALDWLAQPRSRGRRVTTLALRFVDPATGAAMRSVRAEVRHGKRQDKFVIGPLIETAATGYVPAAR